MSEARSAASLRWRLIALALGAVAVVWLATALMTYLDARQEMDEVFDAHLAQAASLLIVQTSHELEEVDTEHAPALHRYAHAVAFQLWEDGRLRLHSQNAPQAPLAEAEPGFGTRMVEGEAWRVFTTFDARGEFLVHVGEKLAVREALARELAEGMLRPLLVGLPLLALMIWLAVRRGLRPLDGVAAQVAARDPNNLAALDTAGVPTEVQPLVTRLNALLAQVERQLEQERRFTADAAHELRTPLAGIRAQAQVARGAADSAGRDRALDALIQGCDRASRLVEQLLTLARIDASAPIPFEPVALKPLAVEVLAELAPGAVEKGVELELAADEGLDVQGRHEWLRILLRNLVDNAVRYTAVGGAVRVGIGPVAGGVELCVTDTGPGIPEAERGRVLERFYRVLGSGEEGSGLGLSIVGRIAEIHGAELRLEEGAGRQGLRVVLRFKPA